VRRIIRKLFKELRPSPSEQIELESLLGAADRLTKKRNDFLHSAWSQTDAGITVLKGEDHQWETAPSESDIDQVTSEIFALAQKINQARLDGLIYRVAERPKKAEPIQEKGPAIRR
jgi:hypothetical protein